MDRLTALTQQINETRTVLKELETLFNDLRLESLRQVSMTRAGDITLLGFKDRIFMVSRNRYGRLKIKEGRQTVDSDYIGGIHDLRFAISIGAV
jgi:hypothetical protein